MPSNHLIFVVPFSFCLQSYPALGSFPMSRCFTSDGWNIEALTSVLPMNIQGWYSLGLTGLISLHSKRLSSVISSTTIQKHQFFSTHPSLWSNSHIHTWRKVKVKSLCHVRLFATLWTVAHQAPPFMGFSRQEYCSGLPFPSPGDLPNPGIKPGSPALQADALTSEPPGKPGRHPYLTTGKTVALTRWTFVSKVRSLLFNTLTRFVIAFLPRSKHLLISWLQSLSSDFGVQENKVCHCFHCFPIYLPWSDGTGCHDPSFLNVEL